MTDPAAAIASVVDRAIEERLFPGAEVLVARGGDIALHLRRGTSDGQHPLARDAIFDLASLTKPVATAAMLERLLAAGEVRLEDRASRFLPAFVGAGREAITLRQLAGHFSGLPAQVRMADFLSGAEEARAYLLHIAPEHAPGERVVYSCIGYLLLGEVIAAVTGQPLDAAFGELVAGPLGLSDTLYAAHRRPDLAARLVPTAPPERPGAPRPGEVSDSTARLLGGVVGNAGLFSSARDLHGFARACLDGGCARPTQRLSPPGMVPPRTLGWELRSADFADASCGPGFPAPSIGHTGFTGTSLWIAPESGLIVIVLSNRTWFSHRGTLKEMAAFRHRIHALAARLAKG